MKQMTRELVIGFLEEEFGRFAQYLDENNIEPTEAETIIKELLDEEGK